MGHGGPRDLAALAAGLDGAATIVALVRTVWHLVLQRLVSLMICRFFLIRCTIQRRLLISYNLLGR